MKSTYIFVGALVLLLALALAGCQTAAPDVNEATDAPAPTQRPCPTQAACPDCPTCPPEPVVEEVPFQDLWANSPHNAAEDEAFVHWNEDDPKEVPADCAKCHSTPGYLDWMGVDGTEFRVVNNPAPLGTTIQCVACHNQATATNDSVLFPSGVEVTVEDASSRCARCHQGRESMVSVNARIESAGLTEDVDTVSADLRFANIHYYAAAATLYGSVVHGGYEYEGQEYEAKFDHVEGYDTCIGCHNPHTTELKVEECAVCHTDVAAVEDLVNIRMAGSLKDYDGDGDIEEGIAFEIEGLQEKAYAAIQAYATEVAGTAIVYNPDAYPYWFADADGNGEVNGEEGGYASWTARLLKAAYNYQVSKKDPGAFAHNGKYIIELLHDSIVDLNEAIATPVDLEGTARMDAGHFASGEEAWRHWDEEGEVPGTCAKCHSATGLPVFLANGTNIAVHPSSGLNCATCHDDLTTFTRFMVETVTFPSGAKLSFDNADSNLCITCHQGRESKVSIDRAITTAGVGADEVSESLSFRNPHYFAAGATLFGTQAKGAYEYEGKQYNGKLVHVPAYDTCVECHDAHSLEIKADGCAQCHGDVALEEIRMDQSGAAVDYDGDGDTTEGLAMEIETMHEALYAALQAYAAENGGAIVFNAAAYPYWFADADGNGEVNGDEGRYQAWTPELLRAAYNYTWVAKDPGAFAHNGDYVLQFLYDSIQAVGGDVSGFTRPAVAAAP